MSPIIMLTVGCNKGNEHKIRASDNLSLSGWYCLLIRWALMCWWMSNRYCLYQSGVVAVVNLSLMVPFAYCRYVIVLFIKSQYLYSHLRLGYILTRFPTCAFASVQLHVYILVSKFTLHSWIQCNVFSPGNSIFNISSSSCLLLTSPLKKNG